MLIITHAGWCFQRETLHCCYIYINNCCLSLPMRDGVVEETLETIAIFKIKKKDSQSVYH
jgi:hypothetical protein